MSDKWPEDIGWECITIHPDQVNEHCAVMFRFKSAKSGEEFGSEMERRWRAYPKLVEALATIPEHRFRLLAAWLDLDDKYKGEERLTEVQDDLRRFADRIVALREAGEL